MAKTVKVNVRVKKAQDLMHKGVETIDGSVTVAQALKKMREKKVSSLIVNRRDVGDAWGIVTKKDIVTKVVDPGPSRRNLSGTKVYEIMSKPMVTVSPGLAIKYCIRLMAKAGVTRAPVFDGKEIIGILSFTDVFNSI
jgi:CBS domain-containing protein